MSEVSNSISLRAGSGFLFPSVGWGGHGQLIIWPAYVGRWDQGRLWSLIHRRSLSGHACVPPPRLPDGSMGCLGPWAAGTLPLSSSCYFISSHIFMAMISVCKCHVSVIMLEQVFSSHGGALVIRLVDRFLVQIYIQV